jgi:hypothetical protein
MKTFEISIEHPDFAGLRSSRTTSRPRTGLIRERIGSGRKTRHTSIYDELLKFREKHDTSDAEVQLREFERVAP